jgi:DNA gyrase subunit A
MLITDQGKIIRMPISGFSVIGRNTQGVRLMVTEEDERIVAVAKLAEKEETDDSGEEDEILGEDEVIEEDE